MTRKTKAKEQPKLPAETPALREPTKAEAASMEAARVRVKAMLEPAAVVVTQTKVPKQDFPHTAVGQVHTDGEGYSNHLCAAFGLDWMLNGINSIAKAHSPKADTVTAETLNAALAFMSDVAPENAVEAALGMQMLATHTASLEMTRRALRADMLPQMEAYGNLATKFSRTFAAQVEALAKLRRKGEQVVRHVHVYQNVQPGGQGVIAGSIERGGGSSPNYAEQAYGTEAFAGGPALPSPNEAGDGVPIPSHAERPLSPARRAKSRGSEGQ